MDSSEVINFSSVERELRAAIESDKKYQRENDAKFRALRQNIASYEEFRDIVLASHLKPLERKDIAGAPRKQPWNPLASASKQRESFCPEDVKTEQLTFRPETASEFHRAWKLLAGSPEKKYDLLISLGGENLRRIFGAEIAPGPLGEFLRVVAERLRPGDEPEALAVLEGLSKTNRFGLGVSFLDRAERDACASLFRRLLGVSGGQRSEETCTGTWERPAEPRGTEACGGAQNGQAGDARVAQKLKALMPLYDVTLP